MKGNPEMTTQTNETNEFVYAGTVSWGTMKSEDLIPSFVSVLKDLDTKHEYKALIMEAESLPYEEEESDSIFDYYQNPDEAAEIVDALFDALNSLAPEGFYFGATEGDGADYGFWQFYEEGEDSEEEEDKDLA